MADEPEEDDSFQEMQMEEEVQQFSALDEYIEAFNTFDVRKLAQSSSCSCFHIALKFSFCLAALLHLAFSARSLGESAAMAWV